MPSKDDHIRRADKNADFASSFDLQTTSYIDWVVTGYYYSALHYLDACLHEHHTKEKPRGYHPASHEERTPLINRMFPSTYRHYRNLKDSSEDARYLLKEFTPEEASKLKDHDWDAVYKFARSRLGL